jgi:hypothetical protein
VLALERSTLLISNASAAKRLMMVDAASLAPLESHFQIMFKARLCLDILRTLVWAYFFHLCGTRDKKSWR